MCFMLIFHYFLSGAISILAHILTGGLGIAKIGESRSKQATTIDMLPAEIVLHIFYFCRRDHHVYSSRPPHYVWKWRQLTHVCQRWRQIIFAFPRRLDIQIYCTYGTPVREILRCWPALPIDIDYCVVYYPDARKSPPGVITAPVEKWDDVMVALEHLDRVCNIRMAITDILLEKLAVVLQRPCPWLASLTLHSVHNHTPALPDAFLGGGAPLLQDFALGTVPFPTFPRFLLSARDLVKLRLVAIPPMGSISTGMMIAGLATFTKLEFLQITFKRSFERQASRPVAAVPSTRTVLPALTRFFFASITREYLEEFVAQIETPKLANLTIGFLSSDGVVLVPELFQFIDRTEYLKLAEFGRARASFSETGAHISLDHSRGTSHSCCLDLKFDCRLHLPTIPLLTQLLSQSSIIFSNVSKLYIDVHSLLDDNYPMEWLEFFCPFAPIEQLFTCEWLMAMLEDTLLTSPQSHYCVCERALKKLCAFPKQ